MLKVGDQLANLTRHTAKSISPPEVAPASNLACRCETSTDEFVTLNDSETATPDKKNAAIYRELQELQDETSQALRGVFKKHRQFVLG